MKKLMLFSTIYFALFSLTYAFENVNTMYINGIAPITVDGELADWEGLNLPTYSINNNLNFRYVFPPKSETDLSATFKCFADNNYFYVAIMVTDDIVIVGNHRSGMGWNDDSAEICFDGDLKETSKPFYDINDGQVRITADDNGIALVEGAIPYLLESQPPYFWEARGVLGGFKETNSGYAIEAAIPLNVLGWDNIYPGKSMGLNIRVFDDDNEINAGMLDHGLTWSDDPQNTSFWKTQYFNRIIFSKEILLTGVIKLFNKFINNGDRDLVLELRKPDNSDYSKFIHSVINDMSQNDWYSALEKLDSVKDKVWSLPLLGVVQAKAKRFDEEKNTLKDFINNSPDKRAQDWAKNEIAKSFKSEADVLIASENNDAAISLLENGLKFVEDDNTDLLMTLGNIHSKRLDYYKARKEYEKILKINPTKEILYDTYMNIGYLCFLSGNTQDARKAFSDAKIHFPYTNIPNDAEVLLNHFPSPSNDEILLWDFLSRIHQLVDECKFNEIAKIYENTMENESKYMKYLSFIIEKREVLNTVFEIYLQNKAINK